MNGAQSATFQNRATGTLMMKIYRTKMLAAIALVGTFGFLPGEPAHAQSGSRICGHTAPTPTGIVGFLLEARIGDNDYNKQCDDAITTSWNTIQNDAQLKKLNWTRRIKNACEDVGAAFATSKTTSDICHPMNSKQLYKITKVAAADATTFEIQ